MATDKISSPIFLENPRYLSQTLSSVATAVVTCPLDFDTICIGEQSRLR